MIMFTDAQLVDLTHLLSEKVPTWGGGCGFHYEIDATYDHGGYRGLNYEMVANAGTHMDAPSHFIAGGKHISEIPLEYLIVPLCVIDLSDRKDPDLKVSAEDILAYETANGKIAAGSLVATYTGWSQFFTDPKKYRNADQTGDLHFPTYSVEAARLLLERDVAGIGIDTLSPDAPNIGFPVHHLILGAGKYIVENLSSLEKMPAKGGYAMILPLRIEEGSESPVRAVGIIP